LAEILDAPNSIAAVDKHKMLEAIRSFPSYCVEGLKLGLEANLTPLKEKIKKISSLVFLGMGGSAIGGSLLKDWAYDRLKVPVEVCRSLAVPSFLNEETLTITVSYSGNTYETLTAFMEAVSRRSPVLTVSSGGKLAEESSSRGLVHLKVPGGLQPRAALPYLMMPVGVVLERLGVFEGFRREAEEAVRLLEKAGRSMKPEIPVNENSAKRLAITLYGSLPAVYGFREYASVAYRFKTQLNENSKVFCKHDVFPELNHNEIVGLEKLQPFLSGKIHIVILRDGREPAEIKAMIEAFQEAVSQFNLQITEVYAEGESRLSRMLYLIHLADYVSFYLAILNGVDPTPISSIASLKRKFEGKLAETV
jgi:glucose/mannose-6-phosphate isomerase